MSRIAFTHDVGVVMKRILLVLPIVLAACDSGVTEPSKNLVPAAAGLSADRGVKGHTFDATFTMWLISGTNLKGVVGGDVGPGTLASEVLNIGTVGDITSIEALHHFNGETHSFTAHVFVTQNNVTGMGVFTGDVTEGWLKGAPVTGEYKVWAICPIPTPGNVLGTECFQGAFHMLRGGGD
jgi:hypothetical protein